MKSKIVMYIRFILIIPAIIIGIVIGQAVALLADYLNNIPSWITPLAGSYLIGFSFFYLGFLTSPVKTKFVANIILILYLLFVVVFFVESFYTPSKYSVWTVILNTIIGFYGVYNAYNLTTKE